jgi:DNA invertase Pin-like site-specific DNA recombinase
MKETFNKQNERSQTMANSTKGRKITIRNYNGTGRQKTFANKSEAAYAMLQDCPALSQSAIAKACDITPQTVLRIDQTYGVRREANPKYAPKYVLEGAA